MERKEFFEVGKHLQCFTYEIEDGKTVVKNATCDCDWSTFNPDAWQEGKTICWHLKTALNNLMRKHRKDDSKN